MRDFYVYGFKSREDFDARSTRTYDDERRRIESWLSDYMQFRSTPDGKIVSISIDSRSGKHNPFYKAWKAKSFTDGDITLHFILMDILAETVPPGLSLAEILGKIDSYLSGFPGSRTFDESTVRKKLKEYQMEGIVLSEKKGKIVTYRRAGDPVRIDPQVLHYFSEVAPLGVIGAFCADKQEKEDSLFAFKHHYITSAMDSEILCAIFEAIAQKSYVSIKTFAPKEKNAKEGLFVPLQVRVSVRSGRQHLMAYSYSSRSIIPVRIDHIDTVKIGDTCAEFDQHRKRLDTMSRYIWGVSTRSMSGMKMEHVEFTVYYSDEETFIQNRLFREKRFGTVEQTDKNHSRFSADVYDSSELIPWIRTFIGRLTDVKFSNRAHDEKFRSDIRKMYALYGLEEDDPAAEEKKPDLTDLSLTTQEKPEVRKGTTQVKPEVRKGGEPS
ncbi:MAG: WYL domain-containing protein [Clostridiales bacterium]|nr:WYL domain-containing protein [Clostridiales bacterium]